MRTTVALVLAALAGIAHADGLACPSARYIILGTAPTLGRTVARGVDLDATKARIYLDVFGPGETTRCGGRFKVVGPTGGATTMLRARVTHCGDGRERSRLRRPVALVVSVAATCDTVDGRVKRASSVVVFAAAISRCGDGFVDFPREECDSGTASSCGSGETCDAVSCTCLAIPCGATAPACNGICMAGICELRDGHCGCIVDTATTTSTVTSTTSPAP